MTLIPAPVSVQLDAGVTFTLPADAAIHADDLAAGDLLAGLLRPATGFALPVGHRPDAAVSLRLTDVGAGDEGYRLDVTGTGITVRALTARGLVHGVQTLRQLLPVTIERRTVQRGPWTVPCGQILDHPRFPYRGAMLDVARHFFGVEVVKAFVDRLSMYKINVLHLHLTDDQGWRIAVDAWPRLATVGGSTQVGGGAGGCYSKTEYAEIVAYAAARQIIVIPEIDLPGHTNAALASYPELNSESKSPPLYCGTDVGFSSLRADDERTYTFVDDVLTELAALTPGPYLHIGGDEAFSTTDADYRTLMNRIQPMVTRLGKTVIGWHQLGKAEHSPGRVVQYWGYDPGDLSAAVANGARVVLSPADKAYLDMKYTADSPLGLDWAGLTEVRTAYDWDPATLLPAVPSTAVLGVEAPLWTETVETPADIDFLTFPRLPALAEVAWSPQGARDWESFKVRLAAQEARWAALGMTFYRSPQVPWEPDERDTGYRDARRTGHRVQS